MKDTFLKRDLTAVIVLFLVFVLILVGLFMWDRNSGVLEVLAGLSSKNTGKYILRTGNRKEKPVGSVERQDCRS